MNPLYRKFTDQVAADAARGAAGEPHASTFDWLAGEWAGPDGRVRFAKAPYGISVHGGTPHLIHTSPAGMWVLVLSDPSAFGILIGLPEKDGQARFSGDVTINSKPVRLRQIWKRTGVALEIRQERFVDGHWQLWDRAELVRVSLAN